MKTLLRNAAYLIWIVGITFFIMFLCGRCGLSFINEILVGCLSLFLSGLIAWKTSSDLLVEEEQQQP
ncbi:hypothetical protein [Bacillus sp. 1P06AnD]|uniref:hypothetical protein n=1 Tax=Bacillus sp. 1P06AnD TaxID=3132208 RepID=UPI00399F4173